MYQNRIFDICLFPIETKTNTRNKTCLVCFKIIKSIRIMVVEITLEISNIFKVGFYDFRKVFSRKILTRDK